MIILNGINLYYFTYNLLSTLLEFEAQGGTIFDSELSGRQRRLTIVTTTGHIFRIGRDPGGGVYVFFFSSSNITRVLKILLVCFEEYGFIGDSAEEFWGTKQRVDLQ